MKNIKKYVAVVSALAIAATVAVPAYCGVVSDAQAELQASQKAIAQAAADENKAAVESSNAAKVAAQTAAVEATKAQAEQTAADNAAKAKANEEAVAANLRAQIK